VFIDKIDSEYTLLKYLCVCVIILFAGIKMKIISLCVFLWLILFIGCCGGDKKTVSGNNEKDDSVSALSDSDVQSETKDENNISEDNDQEIPDESDPDFTTIPDDNQEPDNSVETPDDNEESPIDPNTVPEHCKPLQQGMNNNFLVNGVARSFYLDIPKTINSGTNWPVIFAWHGLGDSAENFRGLISYYVDGSYPYIAVTPVSRAMMVPNGVEWNNLKTDEFNDEVALFDQVLFCLEAKYGTDEDRIHTSGFSAGSIMSDLLGTIRGDRIASIFTYSGAYFANEANVNDLSFLAKPFVSWPDPVQSSYTQVLVHGSEAEDLYGFGTIEINFYKTANNDQPWLNGNGHDTVICNHNQGHTNAGPNALAMIDFFKNHPRNTVSPWRDGLPAAFDECFFNMGN